MEFNVGDFIIMKRGAPYSYTKYKSTGTVLTIEGDQIYVEYDHLTGEGGETLDYKIFWVDKDYCKLIKRPSQQDKVCAKIKQMEARWKKFQSLKLSQQKKGTCHV